MKVDGNDNGLQMTFWGVRGNVAPVQASAVFGNHTTCTEVRRPGHPPLIFDLGTGAYPAALRLREQGERELDVFLTHLHFDHLNALPVWPPLYLSDCTIRFWSTHADLPQIFARLLASPFHPVPYDKLSATIQFNVLPPQGTRSLARQGLTLSWGPLPHPQGCTGYRCDDGTSAVVFATDVDLSAARQTGILPALLSQPYPAGLAVIDGFFTDEELTRFPDWGHGTWRQARELATACGVGTLAITHHHPEHDDAFLTALETATAPVCGAREGQTFYLRDNRVQRITSSRPEATLP
ncbi:MAG: MBL fold metallo-hydrolase [bacterium]